MGDKMRLLIMIPAYNEEKNIQRVVDNLKKNYSQYDYLVINDGSRDQTLDICKRNAYNYINIPVNIGLSGAVQAGMKYASLQNYDAALQYDGDGQHDPEYISKLLTTMEQDDADIVIGSRFISSRKKHTLRMLGSDVIQVLIKLTTGQRITDPTSGMRLYRKKILDEIAWNINCGPEPDTISYLIRGGVKVVEEQVEMHERTAGESYLNFARSIGYMIHMCISIIFIQWFRKRGF